MTYFSISFKTFSQELFTHALWPFTCRPHACYLWPSCWTSSSLPAWSLFMTCPIKNNETPFIIDDRSSLNQLFIVIKAQGALLRPETADLKLSHLSPGIKKKPTTTASFSLVWASWQVSDDEDDAEDGDVQMCVCRVKVSVFFLCVVRLKLRVCVYIQHIRPLLAVFFFFNAPTRCTLCE